MSIYVFNLLVDYYPNGIDNAQVYRHKFLRNFNQNLYYVFTELPYDRDVNYYANLGIPTHLMISPYHLYTGRKSVESVDKVEDVISKLKKSLSIDFVVEHESSYSLVKNKKRIAEVICNLYNKEIVSKINFYKNECLIYSDYYSNGLFYKDHFVTDSKNGQLYARKTRRTFYTVDGEVSFHILYGKINEREIYLFEDGRTGSYDDFLICFIRRLHLTNQDFVINDRSSHLEYTQALFQYGNNAKIIGVMHSGHYFEKNQNISALYMNYEYYYWMSHLDYFYAIVVSTPEQRKDLISMISKYGKSLPRVEVIGAGGISKLRYPKKDRKPYSLITVSRMDPDKRIDLLLQAVIEAQKVLPEITLDLYGKGEKNYLNKLKNIVENHKAESYINFKGFCDVKEVYKNYEVYASASLWETYGLSMLEAIGSGLALIGLDVPYGNHVFIRDGFNGVVVPFSYDWIKTNEEIIIKNLAKGIVKIFSNRELLKDYSKYSYDMAISFDESGLEEKWRTFIS